jgi:hypothetical protein
VTDIDCLEQAVAELERREKVRRAEKGGLAARPERRNDDLGLDARLSSRAEGPNGQRRSRPRRSIVDRANHRRTLVRLKPRRRIGLLYRWFVAVMIRGSAGAMASLLGKG